MRGVFVVFSFYGSGDHPALHSFPTRRSSDLPQSANHVRSLMIGPAAASGGQAPLELVLDDVRLRSEEHTSELQSRRDLVCRLLLEKKKGTCTQLSSGRIRRSFSACNRSSSGP